MIWMDGWMEINASLDEGVKNDDVHLAERVAET